LKIQYKCHKVFKVNRLTLLNNVIVSSYLLI
jgi:hypothetical protein